MNTVWPFVTKFASIIVCTLHCFDRVIFKGHLAMASAKELERFVDYVLRVRLLAFHQGSRAQFSQALVDHARALRRNAAAPICTAPVPSRRTSGPKA